eukprot:TRINITY_DN35579_c0_g1_i2.p1 TRINITY_DN35579_c0_g1~~TRINITY_DN35579_c0_g1_i2.p1  ORF type:complete len:202 (+),score=4.55 TRINITY_DN35579_c0_g1_i2:114-719(+)
MATQGAALQTQNNELVKCIEELREKRESLNRVIREEESEKAKIQQDLQTLTKRLSQINESLARKQQTKSDYEKVIQETEAAYSKIVESSHTLLNVLKKEASSIAKRSVVQPEAVIMADCVFLLLITADVVLRHLSCLWSAIAMCHTRRKVTSALASRVNSRRLRVPWQREHKMIRHQSVKVQARCRPKKKKKKKKNERTPV